MFALVCKFVDFLICKSKNIQLNLTFSSFILWWSWIAFNCGCSYGITGGKWHYAARAGVGTAVATWGAGTFGIAYSSFLHKGKIDVFEVISGIICAMGKIYLPF
jgi:ammonia channel protein AmtB